MGRTATRHAQGGPMPDDVITAMKAETALGRLASEGRCRQCGAFSGLGCFRRHDGHGSARRSRPSLTQWLPPGIGQYLVADHDVAIRIRSGLKRIGNEFPAPSRPCTRCHSMPRLLDAGSTIARPKTGVNELLIPAVRRYARSSACHRAVGLQLRGLP